MELLMIADTVVSLFALCYVFIEVNTRVKRLEDDTDFAVRMLIAHGERI